LSLVWSPCGIALKKRDAIKGHAELFSDQLGLSSMQAVAQFALACVRRHLAVSADRNPGIELFAAGSIKALRGGRRAGRDSESRNQAGGAESDDKCSRALEELAA
jgi:hypothetical protein